MDTKTIEVLNIICWLLMLATALALIAFCSMWWTNWAIVDYLNPVKMARLEKSIYIAAPVEGLLVLLAYLTRERE